MSERKTNNDQLDLQLWFSAKDGDAKLCESLRQSGANINMAIMGVCECQDVAARKFIGDWALDKGACLLFAIQQKHEGLVEGMKYNKNLSMLRGPGDIAKGTFKAQQEKTAE